MFKDLSIGIPLGLILKKIYFISRDFWTCYFSVVLKQKSEKKNS